MSAHDPLTGARRPEGEWPAWIDDLLHSGPLADLEPEWKAEIGDAITKALDARQAVLA